MTVDDRGVIYRDRGGGSSLGSNTLLLQIYDTDLHSLLQQEVQDTRLPYYTIIVACNKNEWEDACD